jgi:hypothetical protein
MSKESENDIFEYVRTYFNRLVPDAIVVVIVVKEDIRVEVTAVYGADGSRLQSISSVIGFPLIGSSFPLSNETRGYLTNGKLNRDKGGVTDLVTGDLPDSTIARIEELIKIDNVYSIGLNFMDSLYGGIHILTTASSGIKNQDCVEVFFMQVSAALQKIY